MSSGIFLGGTDSPCPACGVLLDPPAQHTACLMTALHLSPGCLAEQLRRVTPPLCVLVPSAQSRDIIIYSPGVSGRTSYSGAQAWQWHESRHPINNISTGAPGDSPTCQLLPLRLLSCCTGAWVTGSPNSHWFLSDSPCSTINTVYWVGDGHSN